MKLKKKSGLCLRNCTASQVHWKSFPDALYYAICTVSVTWQPIKTLEYINVSVEFSICFIFVSVQFEPFTFKKNSLFSFSSLRWGCFQCSRFALLLVAPFFSMVPVMLRLLCRTALCWLVPLRAVVSTWNNAGNGSNMSLNFKQEVGGSTCISESESRLRHGLNTELADYHLRPLKFIGKTSRY